MALHRIVTMANHTAEPHAINRELIVLAIEDERKWAEEHRRETDPEYGGSINWDPIDLAKTDTLILSYSRVKTITGLSTLQSLVKLRLDNNEIEHITGLNQLVNLRELDLSMNRIKKISGLNGLKQLTDLSLFCNQISVIEGLDDQKACLEVLSIGRNQIAEQSSIVYLRGFSALRIVCLENNPISQEGTEYRGSTIALLPHLRYLDWVSVSSGDRRQASEAFHRLITEADDVQGGASHVGGGSVVTAAGGRAALPSGGASVGPGGGARSSTDRDSDEAGLFFVTNLWRLLTEASGGTELAGGTLGHVQSADGTKTEGGRATVAGGASAPGDTRVLLRLPGVGERMDAYREAVAAHVEQVSGRGLAAHAEIVRETIAADYVREQYEQTSDAQAKALAAAYLRKRKLLVRQVEGKADPTAAAAGHHHHHKGKHFEDAMASLTLAVQDGVEGSGGAGDTGDAPDGIAAGAASALLSPAPGGDAASVSSESEIAAIESTIRSLMQLSDENDVLRSKLLAIETTLHEQAITVVTEFDAAYAEIAAKRAEMFNKFFRAVEKEEISINDDIKALVTAEVDRYAEQVSAAAAGGAVAGVVAASASKARATRGRGGSRTAGVAKSDGKAGDEDEEEEDDTEAVDTLGDDDLVDGSGGGGEKRGYKSAAGGGGGGGGDAFDEDVLALLSDREAASATVAASHDTRMSRLLATEDKTRMSERERERKTVKARLVAACDRHRLRVAEINALHAHNAHDIEERLKTEQAALAELKD